ncbi:shikimate dehydrogenase [Bacillus songklensis]|uniref:Shikimate dehydrogenase (NADP(+)) n=1 Tax=Bacillus songklensis TaxID=1069116 RepID=A0ABV8B0A9_9BACI
MKKLYGVIGYPVGHSMSPTMHNDAFGRLNMEAYYHAFEIVPEKFAAAVEGLKAVDISGFNVTVPYKVKIMDFLDEVDPLAKAIGAVNTVVNENGRFIGYNTDGEGYVTSLLQALNEADLKKRRVLIIGAGGAARAIYFTLATYKDAPHQIDLCNRTAEKAKDLIADNPASAVSAALSIEEAEASLQQYDIIVNTTSVGMHPHIENTPLQLHHVRKGALVSDIIYNPLETRLLKDAKNQGAFIQNGIGMFVMQGALAFEKWTGKRPDIKAMEAIVLSRLQNQKDK